MLVPLFNLITHRPDLIVDHLAGYLKLAQDEVNDAKQRFVRRTIAGAVALLFTAAFVVLAGVSLMMTALPIWPAQPPAATTATLILVPLVVLLAAIISAIVAMKSGAGEPALSLADHIQRDIQAFRQVIQTKEEGA